MCLKWCFNREHYPIVCSTCPLKELPYNDTQLTINFE